jgi:hypothetical protein
VKLADRIRSSPGLLPRGAILQRANSSFRRGRQKKTKESWRLRARDISQDRSLLSDVFAQLFGADACYRS